MVFSPRDRSGSRSRAQSAKEAPAGGRRRLATPRPRLCSLAGSPSSSSGSAAKPAATARAINAPTKSDGLATHFRAPRCAHARSLTPNDGVEDACDGGGWRRALTCPEEQCAVHPRTSPWMAAALMARPAILHSACTGGAAAKETTLSVSHCCPASCCSGLIRRNNCTWFGFTLTSSDVVVFSWFCGTPYLRYAYVVDRSSASFSCRNGRAP